MKPVALVLLGVAVVLSGCQTRSISNSDYTGPWGRYSNSYDRELSEFNILGVAARDPGGEGVTLDPAGSVCQYRPKKGSGVILIQSGAMFPDDAMQREMSRYFLVAPFSGMVDKESASANFAESLREVAARGGYTAIVGYWGVLETTQKNLATKGVSWVPIVGRTMPDETQRMRIRLKAIVVDVASGQWSIVVPPPLEDMALSGRMTREQSDQSQVEMLKEKGYAALVEQLVTTGG